MAQRTGTFKLRQPDSGQVLTITVTQSSCDYNFTCTPNSHTIDCQGGTVTSDVVSKLNGSDISWEIQGTVPSWLTVTKTSTGLTIKAPKNI